MQKLAEKQVYKKSIILFLCLLIVGNIIHWNVLCIGADGHVELEPAFNRCCKEPDHDTTIPDFNVFSSPEGHEECEHCGPCIDIPVTNDQLQISKTTHRFNLKILSPTTSLLLDVSKFNSSEYQIVSKTFNDTSFFMPLNTVILLI